MNHIERASQVVSDYESLKDTGPPGYNQAVLRDLIVIALREVERDVLKMRQNGTQR
jgi:DNA-directed RNA polymerase subunit K/omega